MTIEEWAKDFKSFVNELKMPRDDYKGIMEYIDDAVVVLKEQEAVEPKITTIPKKDHDDSHIYRCGNCDMIIFKSHKYCPFCGRAVKWE